MNRLTGKNILITGASSGFGRAIALACAAEGGNVALVARDQARLQEIADQITANGKQAVICTADLADSAQVLAAVTQAKTAFGFIDVLVNNAGTNVRQRTVVDTSLEQWHQVIDVNLTAAFLFSKAVLPDMIARQTGTVINVASRAALTPHLKGGIAYSASKMGMDALTQIINEETNPHNVRASLICPGDGNTPLLDRRPVPPPMEARQRMLQPEDVAEVVVLVASVPQHVKIDLVSVWPTRP